MMRRPTWIVLVVALASCGHSQKPARRADLTPRDIMDQSSPAIVVIQSGTAKIGSGFIIAADGLIATNLHVIAGESNIHVKVYKDQTEYPATVIAGYDEHHDLALLRIHAKKPLPTLKLGDSNAVSPGDRIYAIGNPLGVFEYSITDGLISQIRPVSAELTLFQISAPISLGSSGGPLFNQFGEVIGVTTAIIDQKHAQAINLAMPTNYLRPMLKQPVTLALGDFARKTEDFEKHESGQQDDEDVKIERKIPDLPPAAWDGCTEEQMEGIFKAISDTIQVGAPLYNQGDRAGFEACYRVYEGTSLRLEREASCKGVRDAFAAAIERARTLNTFKEKAWALRDTFDGVVNGFGHWCEQDAACRKKFTEPQAIDQTPVPAPQSPPKDRKNRDVVPATPNK